MGTLIVSIQYKIPYWNTSDHALLRSSRMRAGLLFSHEGHMPPATICNISSQRLVGYCWVWGREMNKLHFSIETSALWSRFQGLLPGSWEVRAYVIAPALCKQT